MLGGLIAAPVDVGAQKGSLIARISTGKIRTAILQAGGVTRTAPSISSSAQAAAQEFGLDELQAEKEVASDFSPQVEPDQFNVSRDTLGCRNRNTNGSVRVNQDCTFRRQAEELIKINPTDTRNLIAGQNDSRVGYNKCGFDYSFDGGQTWGDGIPPFYQRENHPELDGPTAANPNRNTIAGGTGTAHTYDAGSDPALAFDSVGRAYYSCVFFDVHSNASGVLVTQSPEGAGGAFYDNVTATGRAFVVAEDNGPVGANQRIVNHDKEFITADSYVNSPNRDNVYITWTVFDFKSTCRGGAPDDQAFCSSAIFGSMSTDHGLTWSTPEPISGNNPQLCFFGNFFDPTQSASACNLDQGSDPVVLPDGRLAVIFNNGNTPPGDINAQQLSVTCSPSGQSQAGTAHLNCAPPSKVGADVVNKEPLCDFGRGPEECIPGPFIRTNDFPRMAVDKQTGELYAVWQDYRHGEFEIQLRKSIDAGRSWQGSNTPVSPAAGVDEYMPAVDVGANRNVAVSFYRSSRVPNENFTPEDGFTVGRDPGVQQIGQTYWLGGRVQPSGRATSVPFALVQVAPLTPPPDGAQAGFNGDYSGIAVTGNTAYPIWSDTRNAAAQTSPSQGVVHDEDVFSVAHAIPSGSAATSTAAQDGD